MYCELVIRTVAQVVGDNVRRRRIDAGITLDTLAAASPLSMSTGRIGNIEAARSASTLETLVAMAAALSRATMEPVTLADLLDGDGDVSLGDQFKVELATLRAALSGEAVSFFDAETERKGRKVMADVNRRALTQSPEWKLIPKRMQRGLDPLDWLPVYMAMRESDVRMCKSIGADRETGAAIMANLWGRPFSEERDHRAGPDAKAQRKGQISRQLKAQLEEAVP